MELFVFEIECIAVVFSLLNAFLSDFGILKQNPSFRIVIIFR